MGKAGSTVRRQIILPLSRRTIGSSRSAMAPPIHSRRDFLRTAGIIAGNSLLTQESFARFITRTGNHGFEVGYEMHSPSTEECSATANPSV